MEMPKTVYNLLPTPQLLLISKVCLGYLIKHNVAVSEEDRSVLYGAPTMHRQDGFILNNVQRRRRSIAESSGINTDLAALGSVSTITSPQGNSDDVIDVVHQSTNDEIALCSAERYCFERTDSCTRISKLSRRMCDILGEQSSMCFFVQFMESRKALSLVKFWLDVESFKAAAFESGCRKSVRSDGHHVPSRKRRIGTSEVHESLSNLSLDCDSLSTNSCSENTFEDTHSTADLREMDCRSLPNCIPVPTTSLEIVTEYVDIEEDILNTTGNVEKSLITEKKAKELDVCDITIMQQSLTDDEKTQICEAGKPTSGESCSAKANEIKNDAKSMFNSLINSDAVRIYKKYLTTSSPHYIEVPATILSTISLTLCSGACTVVTFDEVQHFLLELLESNYLNAFLESSFYCTYTLDVLTSKHITLIDILGSEMALFYFMEYLEQHKKQHYLECYVAAVNFKQSYENEIQAQKDALVLYEKYFSLQATCPLKLGDNVRFKLEEQICLADPSKITICFDMAVQIIERFLEQRFFAGFIQSSLYDRFITELLGKVSTNLNNSVSEIVTKSSIGRTSDSWKSDGSKGHCKALANASEDRSCIVNRGNITAMKTISSQNTLLAMSDINFKRNREPLPNTTIAVASNMSGTTGKSGSASHTDIMQIDSRQLYNPDLLWRRNSAVTGLTFGRVDALGRYERDFDMAGPPSGDDRWNRNKIKKAVRKLVNLPEDKVQEELAWEVAEMIVKDITNVTMNNMT